MKNHKLNDQHLNQIKDSLGDFLPLTCKVCGENINNISFITGVISEIYSGNNQRDFLETINFICEKCGHIELFSSEALGLKFDNQL